MKKAIIILGPTGVGKSQLAIRLAQEIPSEIISADSMQIYKNMDIGTNKFSIEERMGIPHHFIDIIDPIESYSVADFQKNCFEKIDYIQKKGKIPIIVGGTGLYIWSILNDCLDCPKSDSEIRSSIQNEIKNKGLDFFYNQLLRYCPEIDKYIHQNDEKRIIRALEVYLLTKKPIYEYWKIRKPKKNSFLILGIYQDRKKLYEKLNQRCEKMIEKGLIEEIRKLVELGCSSKHNSMKAIGYRHFLKFLEKKVSLKDITELFKRDTRRLAKRQYTFFSNKITNIKWVISDNLTKIEKKIKKSYNLFHI